MKYKISSLTVLRSILILFAALISNSTIARSLPPSLTKMHSLSAADTGKAEIK